MSSEPTSTLAFTDLILIVSEKLGTAYYGANGDQAAAIPTNAQDLAQAKKIVNDAIRMFVHDGPQPNGWRWLRPVASLVLWPDIATDAANAFSSATYDGATDKTTLVVPTAAFYPSMELKTISITTTGDCTITDYVSATSVKVSGDKSSASAKTWSMTADGNYTLPIGFGGQYLGELSFAAATNKGIGLDWVDESTIRVWRSDVNSTTGIPYQFAVKVMDTGTPRRRWELLAYPKPSMILTIQFPYMLHFDSLVNLTDVHPAPFGHDETIRAACKAQVEKDVEHALGTEWDYYRNVALPNSYRVDAMSAPKKLGYFWNPAPLTGSPLKAYRNRLYQRPTVSFNQ
jgi:hypothetical protein